MSSHHPTYTMAALLAIGGIMGYVRRGSVISLAAGVGIGAGFGVAGYMLQQGQMTNGHATAFALSSITMAAMGIRAINTKGKVPIAVASLCALSSAYHANKFLEWAGQE
ncbi:hypothetical protein LEN26_014856 [Aphanomyces euteiches]|uniref:Transmembrane protein 14C n=1 Tax=Aphanomyces euteiches TaxID=100861 RepID=A0A6G0WS30_9STRA|nr:hypothetical protein Ae201684_012289 [Aphanomyces euteiches]KAH9105148.1 hypothetical protein LEN26_014856 [Aphanomyces euteiches]KAH9108544.1 hypothetical protein AeMF1_016296 [Aphanomyces euteiches]KAH9139266.1 hypothetical protein AeRB84_016466 [Aphanomyces euteiches]KAH9183334.1 hypothetical protein AeNC1_014689 [Aphanomyces euteiches]